MKWKVIWRAEAERRLTVMWLAGRRRTAITTAAQELDAALALDAENVGESRDANQRIVLIPPLGARIEIDSASHTVHVLTIWEY